MRCSAVVRAGELGFLTEPTGWGDVYRRSQTIDLVEFLEAAGLDPGLRAVDLCRLDPRLDGLQPEHSEIRVLDIEAVGVASGHLAAFLVGIGTQRGRWLHIEQFLLAEVGAEAALLRAVAALVNGSFLLTYNGRAFDLRVLGSRCVANGIHPAAVEPRLHVDLLASTRRLFRAELRSCTLRQAEMRLLRYFREDDIPGIQGPSRFRAWLRGAPAAVLAGVIEHNRLDVCGTAALAARLVAQIGGATTHIEVGSRYNLSR
jgi:uncharacterized protein YprB with RNaseH-like and TPR domain